MYNILKETSMADMVILHVMCTRTHFHSFFDVLLLVELKPHMISSHLLYFRFMLYVFVRRVCFRCTLIFFLVFMCIGHSLAVSFDFVCVKRTGFLWHLSTSLLRIFNEIS